ncbi:MAG: hypothetical protein AAB605_01985 [Patescibacteria group bacterium]
MAEKMRPLNRLVAKFTRSGREKIRHEKRQEEYLASSDKERSAHNEGLELQIPRLRELKNTLGSMVIDDQRIRELARFLHEALSKKDIPHIKTLSDDAKRALLEEAKQYIFRGILQPYKKYKDEQGREHDKPLVNEDGVKHHLRIYLQWRWAEEAWRKKEPTSKWKVWKRSEKEMLAISMPNFEVAFKKWKGEQKKLKRGEGPTRPPTPPEANLVLMLAKRLREDHMQWKVSPIKPGAGEEKKD